MLGTRGRPELTKLLSSAAAPPQLIIFGHSHWLVAFQRAGYSNLLNADSRVMLTRPEAEPRVAQVV